MEGRMEGRMTREIEERNKEKRRNYLLILQLSFLFIYGAGI